MYYHVLPCIAMYYHVLPCIAMYYHVYPSITMYIHVLPCNSMYSDVLPYIAMYYHVSPWITMYCFLLPCVAMYYHVLPCITIIVWDTDCYTGGSPRKGSFSEWKDIFPRRATFFHQGSFPLGFKVISVGVTRKTPRVMEETKPPPNLEHACPIVPLTYIVFATSLISESLGQTNSTVESLLTLKD